MSLVLQACVDIPVAQWAHRLPGSGLFRVAQVLPDFGDSAGYLVVTGVCALLLSRFQRYRLRARQALYLFLGVALSGLSADLLKLVFARSRPVLLFESGIYGFHWFQFGYVWNSFPSGHATTMGALAAAVAVLFPRARVPAAVLAAVIASSRIVVNAHYLSDVVMGFTWGACAVMILTAWFGDLVEKAPPAA